MNKTAVGIIAAVSVTAVLGVTGVSLAAAQPEGYSTIASPAPQLEKAYKDLAIAAEANDLTAIRAAVAELIAALTTVHKDADRGLLRPEAAKYLSVAEKQSAELRQRLSEPTPRDGIGDALGSLVSSVLDAVKNLLNSLLGGGSPTTTTTTTSPKPAG